MAEHARLLREAFGRHFGEVIDTQGDSFFVAFPRVGGRGRSGGLGPSASWLPTPGLPDGELRLRMGIHTGEATVASERYLGLAVHRASRIGAAGHGAALCFRH